ncbi:MAG: mechanosensitive ion channel family protein [PVC group bacterium]|nr:mechanosensitive ion channel family protein [PVC group bacterium]
MSDLIRSAIGIGIIVLFGFSGLYLRKKIFGLLHKIASRTSWKGDDLVISALKSPFVLWCILLGVYVAIVYVQIPSNISIIANKVLFSTLIISITAVIAKICVSFSTLYAEKLGTNTDIVRSVIYAMVFAIGLMFLFNALGISIAPLLTTLGIGGLAVALGLQDTLANLFSGLYITAAKQVRIGDYIKLDSGEEGYVVDISWRTTKIKPLHNNLILVPNFKLGEAIITNYYLPEKELAVKLEVGVHYDSDLERVEKVTVETAEELMQKINGAVAGFKPFIRYHTFDSSSINFTVFLRAKEFVDHYLITHEFIKELHKRYAQEDIVIPYPIRAINYSQEKVEV